MKESEILFEGKTLIYPTDTIWGIGCDARNICAIDKVKAIKGRDNTKSLIVLVKDIDMLANYVEDIPQAAKDMLAISQEPTTIIYPNPKNLPIKNLSFNNSIGIRIPNNAFLQNLFAEFPFPIVSTSANFSGKPSPTWFDDIDKDFLSKADYVSLCNRNIKSNSKGSSIYIIGENKSLKKIR